MPNYGVGRQSYSINDLADKDDDCNLSEKQNEILNRISQKLNRG